MFCFQKRTIRTESDMSDIRVSNAKNQDAAMMDVRERDKPPGDPPDGRGDWVKKVVGCNAGGRVRPELVLDHNFVSAIMEMREMRENLC